LIAVLAFTLIFASASVWDHPEKQDALPRSSWPLQMEFVASVSHELRTPLAIISSAADNIVDGLVSRKEELQSYGAVIRNPKPQITELVNQILQ